VSAGKGLRPALALFLACFGLAAAGAEAGAANEAARQICTPMGVEMVLVPGGEFAMGDAAGAEDAKAIHRVRISAFYMDKFEVSQGSFLALTGLNTSKVSGPKLPVEQTSWLHAARYCNARSEKEGIKPCYDPKTWACDFAANGYRLPTEAEWEYACRAGTTTVYSFGDEAQKLPAYAWLKSNAAGVPHPVGTKQPNPWGLYDLHGNVLEWCHDYYAADYYRTSPGQDPTGPVSGELRVLRGGGWRSQPKACASAWRGKDTPANLDTCLGYPDYGFRCVRRAP
jgi:formylglycine-generating enzyme required for sulfatase activity